MASAGDSVMIPACRFLPPANSLLPKVLSYPSKPGLELLKGWVAFDGDGQSSLSACLELLAIKKLDVDVGVERLEAVIFSLESSELRQGLLNKQNLGCKGKEKVVVRKLVYLGRMGLRPIKRKRKKEKKGLFVLMGSSSAWVR
jgi:hypothetical protein